MKIIKIISASIIITLLGWFGLSYIDVIVHNLTPGYEYPFWNILGIR